MLTGFDAKKVNTLYVDKNLKYHGLIQAYSRTNRILGDQKSQGNILAFRNLKKATDEAITLFSNKEAIEVVTMPDYEVIAQKLSEALKALKMVAPSFQSVDDLESETDQANFVEAFRKLMRHINVLSSYTDFDWEDLPINEQEFEDYKSKYLDLHDKVKLEKATKEKVSILDDIDFELELIHKDKINVDYIKKLITTFKEAKPSEAEAQKKLIIDLLGGEVTLRSKRELIQKFIEENLPNIQDADKIEDEFEQFWQKEKVDALHQICEEEKLDERQFNALVESYIYSGREPIKDDIMNCLDNRPSILQARTIGNRIINKMRAFIETFVEGMVG
jgi:type I restriction enzyme R subunit